MQKINFNDVRNIYDYEKIRKEFREKVIALKKNRRLPIGDNITLVFENRDTVLFQIQEMIRVERIVDDEAIQHEIDVYNQLIPDKNQICATMLIEIREKQQIKPILDSLVGLNRGCVYLEFGGEKIEPIFDQGQLTDERISAVQYLTFNLTDDQIKKFSDSNSIVKISIHHQNYNAEAVFTKELHRLLIEDLSNNK